ncbi:N-acetylmuramic acid 6-phosphate etherase [Pluralibacter gergoviae]|uniref:N-acetylmuramic acid 6-phosphate etherase n=1 Tax=Pluralibacter gergoviae TaxID=61647 RepID=A0AAI9GM26_PLUGE|nr:N-acetylmuramic acid 6-phosphate etherase [Pluralibacter gergoviae]EKT9640626.1 N-acetylmuramic acid 6-phosphate etherase [Pluralibacter gergoviae]EKV0916027.1 N-acetylmuramic acid 6-phosphate etherase [Pluralibacter gergoviae]EKV3541711.1 N-acetylmuramic acid 6-phosphate etherase [Pluralibacter gergoviae]EKV9897737.1 N-acetylmuramic acid 6-phosphate etherase [Pluralibacter gergoviae]EKV9908103.1 N-acetylmuramic acid 6-phosphate etherase [Pluralibacter gergoviae]
MKIDLSTLTTESRNAASENIDQLPTLEMLTVINNEDKKVALAVEEQLPAIARAVDAIAAAFAAGGRLIYCGAGTSGRLGILDASECPPTYGTPREMVVGLIAGGKTAILQAVENAEDSPQMGEQDLRDLALNDRDVVVGIAASGRTPYVIGALRYARSVGAKVGAIACNRGSEIGKLADFAIEPLVGPEVVTGSSRMKAGTAQKLILNMLTTGAMIRSGKVFGNLMVDVEATNAKLLQRQVNIVVQATECTPEQAQAALDACHRHCKTAIVMILAGVSAADAEALLASNSGFIRRAIQGIGSN